MKRYDWSKLDAGWTYEGGVLVTHDPIDGRSSWKPSWLERTFTEETRSSLMMQARAQLAKCRIALEPEPSPEYDWSKLEGSGWKHDPDMDGNHMITNVEFEYWYNTGLDGRMGYALSGLFDANRALVAQQEAERLVAKCRVAECDHDWNYSSTVCMRCRNTVGDLQMEQEAPVMVCRPDVSTVEGQASVERELNAIQSQFTEPAPPECDHDWDDTCRVCVKCGEEFGFERAPINNTPLFDAIDKMAAEVPAEEWAKVPPISNCATERFGCTPCPACGKHGLHLCEKFYPEPPSTKWFHPSQPWRRGPLAAWTLVNISNHDGRLTVVMRRGRSEVLIETGPDDETLWERLGKKAVEADKAKSKEKCDV